MVGRSSDLSDHQHGCGQPMLPREQDPVVSTKAAGHLVPVPDSPRSLRSMVYVRALASRARYRAVAQATLRWAARDLDIDPPRMRFFVPIGFSARFSATTFAFLSPDRLAGFALPEGPEIWINVMLARRETVNTVAHECKHVALGLSPRPEIEAIHEMEARLYGNRVGRGGVARHVGRRQSTSHSQLPAKRKAAALERPKERGKESCAWEDQVTGKHTAPEPRERYEELLRQHPEMKEYECERCAGDLRRGVVHPLWIAAALGCMVERRHMLTGSDHAHTWVRDRFLRFFGSDLAAAEALAVKASSAN